jgi:hypothetical protein
MSFALTTKQILDRTKTITRRLNWKHIRAGDLICAVKKGMGLKPGEKIQRLAILRIVHVNREPLYEIRNQPWDCRAEGFPHWTTEHFISMFCEHMKCTPQTEVTRIGFKYISDHQIDLFVEDYSQPIGKRIEEAMRRGIEEALRK